MTGHITESIFDGKTHIIPLADVAYMRKQAAEVAPAPFPHIPEGITVFLGSSETTLFLHGDEAEAFTRDWCPYRHELEKDTLYPMHVVETVKLGDAIAETRYPAGQRPDHLDAGGSPIVTDDMVSRFLSWRLPDDFHPDCGIRFAPLNHPNSWPIGTNLFTATQAKAMLEHVLKP